MLYFEVLRNRALDLDMDEIKVLFVEDDRALRMVISETLMMEGFTVLEASDGIAGLEIFSTEKVDVVVADIMMPHLDGLDMVARMRLRDRMVPILFLTAKSSADSVVEGFNAGADDYLRKPFSMKELIVRIRALYARANASGFRKDVSDNIKIGSFLFDPVSQHLQKGNQMDVLSSRESEILHILVENINNVVTTTHIMKSLWGDDSYYITKSLQVFITRLRRRLKGDPSVRIVNARGIGYKLVVDIPK